MSYPKEKVLFSTAFFFVVVATLLYTFQYIAEVLLLEDYEWNNINVTLVKFTIIGLVAFVLTFFFLKWQRISLSSLGLQLENKIIPFLILGAVLGMLALLITASLEIAGDVAKERVITFSTQDKMLLIAFQILFVGPGEELIFRGYIQNQTEKAYGTKWAIMLASCAFGLIHVLFFVSINPESVMIIFVSSTIAGIGFGYAMKVSGNLAYPIALHSFWNVFAFVLDLEYVWGYDPKAVGFLEFIVESTATAGGIGIIILATYLLSHYTSLFQREASDLAGPPIPPTPISE